MPGAGRRVPGRPFLWLGNKGKLWPQLATPGPALLLSLSSTWMVAAVRAVGTGSACWPLWAVPVSGASSHSDGNDAGCRHTRRRVRHGCHGPVNPRAGLTSSWLL